MSENNHDARADSHPGVTIIAKKAGERRRLINIILAVAGIAIIFFYTTCLESCAQSQGTLAGIDLKYLGIAYMGLIVLLNILRRDDLNFLLLVLGTGAEIFLIGYQVRSGAYCLYCLMFAAVVIALFMLNFDKSKKALIAVFLTLGFLLLFVWFRGTPLPSYAADNLLPLFGKGKIEVRVYTDYFCGPCASVEPKLESLLADLLENNSVNILFVDTPVHNQTRLYVHYFLYILNEEMNFGHAVLARRVLFEAARKNITEKEKLENLLRERNIKFQPFDPTPTFNVLSRYLAEDVINSTPTVVICRDGEKKKFKGLPDVLTALEDLKKKSGENPEKPAKK